MQIRRCLAVLIPILSISPLSWGQDKPRILTAKPTEVVVYADRAQVTRRAQIQLESGTYHFLFDDLPASVQQESIQVNGSGPAVLNDVRFKQIHFSAVPDTRLRELENQKQQRADDLQDIDDLIKQATNEKSFVDRISKKLTNTDEKSQSAQLNPDKWVKMVAFYRQKFAKLDKEIRHAERKKRHIQSDLDKIERDIQSLGSQNEKSRNQVEILLNVKKPGIIKLDLVYMVPGPSWKPLYDFRVQSKKKNMHITYNAIIQQNTGEDWHNVKIKLSTARPQIAGKQPKLMPLFVMAYRDKPQQGFSAPNAGALNSAAMGYMFKGIQPEVDGESTEDKSWTNDVTIDTKATSVVFDVNTSYDVLADNQPHKVTVMSRSFPAHFRYSAVPKHSPYAYLKANIINTSDFPFLAGESNVYLDSNFVAKSSITTIAPQENFWTNLGIDESIKIEYKFINKFEKQGGVFSSNNKYTYKFMISATNNKKTEAELVIWDQIPIARNDKVKVKLLKPTMQTGSKHVKLNEHHYLEWYYKPKAGETLQIPLVYTIEFPKDMNLATNVPEQLMRM